MSETTLHFDGGSRGNPGPAGAAALLRIGEVEVRLADYLAHATNNEAEYRALLIGLAEAKKRRITSLQVYGDSKLVISQVNGNWACKSPTLQPLHHQALSLAREFERVRFQHLRRHHNSGADALANRAMDAGQSIREEGPPLPPHKAPAKASAEVSIEALLQKGPEASFSDFARINVPGRRDTWTGKRFPALVEAVEHSVVAEIKSLWIDSRSGALDDSTLAKCLRWVLRGLPPAMAVRKVQVDAEVAQKAAKRHKKR